MTTSIAYIAASTNRHPRAADISIASTVAFGSSNSVVLWNIADETDHGVSETLPGHEGLVTCIHFISNESFVSADDKGVVLCWRKLGTRWKSTGKVQAHPQAVSSICARNGFIVTGSSDASVKIWSIIKGKDESDGLEKLQTITLKGKYPLALALANLPQSQVTILAIAGTDRSVHIWARSEDVFVQSAVLTGHEDWVRSLAFKIPLSHGEPLTLASGSQDATIRLWRIEQWKKDPPASQSRSTETLGDDLLDAFEASLRDLGDAEEGGKQISLRRHILTFKSDQGSPQQFSITFDALLVGHEAGITSLAWRPTANPKSTPTLLSTSTDSSVILWSPSAVLSTSENGATAIWINRQRFGDIGGQRLGGFVGGAWAQHGDDALAWGWSGGWRRWHCTLSGENDASETWAEAGAIGGHSGPVKCLDWSPSGEFLLSVGLDQTTRVHGAIPSSSSGTSTWHELSRPQVHGYDVLGVRFLDTLKFVSIADEKVARVFEAPRGFVDLVETLDVAKFSDAEHVRPQGASVPPLGLSNKASDNINSQDVFPIQAYNRRPFEGDLAATTLWPEIEKVFGHGYESMTLAVSPSRKLMATACKATTAEHAVVRIYDTTVYRAIGEPLEGHSLTVTSIAFSPDDRYVLSVSRDRSWRLYEVQENGGFTPVAADKSHGRIIWDCAWASEGDVFATASRDKTVKIWGRGDAIGWTAVTTLKTQAPATAVAFAAGDSQYRRRLAVGLETGEILIYSSAQTSVDWRLDNVIDSRTAHVNQIHRLAWRPTTGAIALELASCSEDGTLKILIVQMAVG